MFYYIFILNVNPTEEKGLWEKEALFHSSFIQSVCQYNNVFEQESVVYSLQN